MKRIAALLIAMCVALIPFAVLAEGVYLPLVRLDPPYVNTAPSFVAGVDQVVLEDSGQRVLAGWATAISPGPGPEADQRMWFLLSSDNPSLLSDLSLSPAGALSYTPAPNANGVAHVSVWLHDSGGTARGGQDLSAAQPLAITVLPVNDAPAFTKTAIVSVYEDVGGPYLNATWATNVTRGPANESGQTLNDFVVIGNTNTALFSQQPTITSTGLLRFTTATNANGSATVTVRLQDNAGVANGGHDATTDSFQVVVGPTNDPPAFTLGTVTEANQDAAPVTVAAWASAISPGPTDEAAQPVAFQASNTNNALFTAQPAIAANGTLTYAPAAGLSGQAIVTVALADSGGTANGGNNTSATQQFVIDVVPPIAYTSGGQIYVVNADGTGATNLSINAFTDSEPAWRRDGTQLAFTSTRNAGGDSDVCLMNRNGTGQACLTDNTFGDEHPTWSPDGTQIAFATNRDGNWEIYVMDSADGGNLTNLTNTLAIQETQPAWSGDGQNIAYVAGSAAARELWLIPAIGGTSVQLTANAAADYDPAWSPDDSNIAFTSERDGNPQVYVMLSTALAAPTHIMSSVTANDSHPTWSPPLGSPARNRMAFVSNRSGAGIHMAQDGETGWLVAASWVTIAGAQPTWLVPQQ